MRYKVIWTLAIVITPIFIFAQRANTLTVDILKCNYKVNPLGIDDTSPRFFWTFKTKFRNQYQAGYRIIVSSSKKNLMAGIGDMWDSKRVSDQNNINICYEGRPLQPFTRYFWKVRAWNMQGIVTSWSSNAYFETAFLNDSSWKSSWICNGKKQSPKDEDFYKDNPAPEFSKAFSITKPIESARLYISGLGYYEASLNGKKIGDNVLDPGWTNYAKTVLYSTYDISSQIHKGKNTISVLLGNGWYNPLPLRLFGSFNLRKELTIGQPRMIAYLLIHYLDGSFSGISTDSSWQTADSYILQNSIYLGEKQDARINAMPVTACRICESPGGKLTAQITPPVRITKLIPPIKRSEPKKNVWVFDMGENFAGLIRMKVHGSSGQSIHFRYGELLFPDGHVNGLTTVAGHIKEMWNMKGGPGSPKTAYQEDNYICNGNGTEIFQPRFTFHAFRYVEISGLTVKPLLSDVQGLRMNSDVPENGNFFCSNTLFNKIQQNTLNSFLSNIFSVQSDCPGRERQGYGADMVVSADAFMFNYDMSSFYSKAVHDFKDDARPNGGMPECAPYNGIASEGFEEGAGPIGWQLAFSFLQEKLFRFYGNKRIIEDNYEQTRKMVEFLKSESKDFLIDHGIGDHVSVAPKHVPLTSGAFYYQHVKILAAFAKILGKTSAAEKYNSLADSILNAFNLRYLKSGTGLYDTSSNQTTQVFPLWNEMVPEEEKNKVLGALWNDILIKNNGHLSTGIFGTKMLFDLCRQYNRNDIAQTIVNKTDYPGYGYMIKNGATTLWETWEKPDQNSWNHPMFGSVSEWFYRSILGINPADNAIGFDKIILNPFFSQLDSLNESDRTAFARGYYYSIRGKIVSSWTLKNKRIQWHIEIPVNTSARIYIPSGSEGTIYESKKPVLKNPNMHFIKNMNGISIFDTDSGSYDLTFSK